jgi:hypothetical protein
LANKLKLTLIKAENRSIHFMKNRIKNFFPSLPFSSSFLTFIFPFSSLFSRLPLSYLLLTFLTLFAGSVASAQIPSSGLVGYWPFNGNANDESGNGNNGTVNGAALTIDRFGNANSAYNFDGVNDFIDAGDFYNFGNSNFTVSCWFKLVPTSANASLVSKREVNMQGNWWVQEVNGFQIDESAQSSILTLTHPTPLNKQLWTNYIIIREGNILSFYVNGVLSDQETLSTAYNMNNNANLLFGTTFLEGSYVGLLKGKLDDISIYSRAIDSEEISSLYTTTTSTVATPPCPTLATNLQTGLVGYWPFCGNANDESGNGNNGTVNGATLTTDRFGNANSAYSFDGVNDFIQTLNPGPTGTGISVSYWYKSIQTTQNIGVIVFGGNSWASYFEVTHNHWASGQGPCNGPGITGGGTLFNPGAYYNPNDNIWHHVVVSLPIGASSFDQTLFYLDGALISNSCSYANYGAPSPNIGSANPIKFGRSWQIAHPVFYQGVLDDISIYNRALTPAEITQLYTDQTSIVEVPCSPFLGEDQTVCAGTSVALNATSTPGPVAACTTLPLNLQTGLVGYWPFCGNANDASGNGNNGTVNGATLTTDRFGNQNSAYSFSNNLISVPHNESLGIQQNGMQTVSAWINVVGNQSVQHLIGKRPNGAQQFNWQVSFNYPANQGLTYTGNLNFTNTGVVSNFNPQQNIWVHLVCVYNNGVWSIYVNGTLINSISTGLFYPDVNCPLTFGNAGSFQPFYGSLDEIAIYNRVLSLSEIQQLYTLDFNSYLWSNGATTPAINVTPTTTTTYTCTVTEANGNACTDSVTVFVPQIEATDLTICAGESTTLSVSGINSTATQACVALPTNLQTGLVGYWPFCGNANDASVNGNNGTVNGATLTTDRFGNANNAYNFDGVNDFIQCPSTISALTTATISGWAFCNSLFGGQFVQVGEDNNTNCNGIGVGKGGFNPVVGIGYGFNFWNLFQGNKLISLSSCVNYYDSGYSLTNGIWFHYAMVKQNNLFLYYINGALVGTSTILPAINPTNKIFIGCSGSGGPPTVKTFFSGQLDDVAIHSSALTAAEIQQLYTLGQTDYLWSNGATTPTINVSPTTTTTYTCTVISNGVSCTDSVTVVVNNPILNLGSDVTVCGTSTTLTAPAGYDSYSWSNGGATNTTTVTAIGTYTCTVTQGACSASDAVDVTLINATISATDSVICAGETITLSVPQGGSCAALPTNLQTGLVGYWPFCGNANDESGNGNNGIVNGATLTTDRFGNENSAYGFDGDNSIITSAFLDASLDLSLSFWVNSNSAGNQIVVNTIPHTILAYSLNPWWAGTGNIGFLYGNGQSSGWQNGGVGQNYFLNPIAFLNNWVNHTIVKNGVNWSFYENGVLIHSYQFNSQPANIISQLVFGHCDPSICNEGFHGKLDNFIVHNRALSSNEVLQLYNQTETTYLWSTGATTPAIDVSPTTTTTYTCTITSNGVTCNDSVTVVVNNPTIDLGSDVTACGTSTTLTAPSGYDSYAWSNGGTTNTTTVTANGTYTCTVTQGGCSASDSVDVTLIDATISATDSVVCAGETVLLNVGNCPSISGVLSNGEVGFWPFCGNANDESGNGNNGTVNGAILTTDRFGALNSAYSFDGINDAITTPFVGVLGSQSRTVSFWADVNPFSSEITVVQYGSTSSANGPGDRFGCKLANNGIPSVGIDIDGSQITYAYPNLFDGWHLFSWTYSSADPNVIGNVKVYVDGNLLTTITQNYVPNSAAAVINTLSDSPVVISANQYNNVFFGGKLDDLLIHNRALSASEIQQLYTLGQTNYLWSNGATTPTINVSPTTTTTYTCTVTTNGVSCTDTITVVVGNPVASITPNGMVEICEGESIALTGNGGESYLWSTGAPTQSITVNTEAVYTVTVTDANGCTDTESQLVKVNFLPNIGVNNAAICPGQSATLTASGGVSYVWSPATGLSATTGTTVTASPATSTVYSVTGTGANGCTNSATAAVIVNALPTATITPATSTTFCQGGSVVLNANTGTGLTYQWFNNASAISGATSASYTANASGSYTVTVTNASTCSSTSTGTVVTVNALPVATITPATATTFCQGGSVVLNANTGTGLSYQWRLNGTNITGATTSSYSANASGSYTVVVTNTSTCSSTSTATVVTVNALPTSTITPATATTFCQGGSVVLNANTGTGLTYLWRLNGNPISGATSSSYTANSSGSYTVVVTNASTCSSTSTATVVTVNALPIATITPAAATTFCQGGSVVLNANTGAGLSYQWFNNASAISGATSASYTANASGSYTVTVTNTSTCSSTSTAAVVTVNALPTSAITASSATTFCQGGSVVLNANTGTGLSYQWRLNGNPISGATTSSYIANASGSYTVVVTNATTCSSTSPATVVTVNALPVASISPNGLVEICQGQSIALTANGGVSYLWSTGAPTQSISVSTEALYTVTVTDINGCTDTESQFVKVNLLPNIGVNNASICLGQSASLTATGGLSYVWSPATGLSATTGSTVTSSTTTNTVYTVTGTGANGCTNSATATVTVNALPVATIIPATATTFCQGGSVVLNANTGTGLTYQWRLNGNPISGATSSSYTANASGSYTVVVTNASTCSSTSTAIDVTAVPNVDYFADTDGDGFGDITTLTSTCVQPQGYVTDNNDCKDNDASIYPGAQEICNDIDDDCNELIDDGLVFITYYADADGDTFGDANNPLDACVIPDGYVTNNTDCNDNNANQNAASAEICNGEDDDCDGAIDNGITFLDYYADADGDGFGTGDVISSCSDLGAGYVTNNTDCDDTNSNTNPSATETCNTIDDNCDGQIDEGVQTVYFIDNDGDTYGNPSVSILACTQPIGYTPDDNDCNDTDANINPGAEDIADNGIDENCDGQIDNSIFELNASINLYPNPTRSELNIQVNSSIIGNDLYIFDAVGKMVFKQKLLSTQTILPVSNFPDGNYIFRVGELVKRFVVQK